MARTRTEAEKERADLSLKLTKLRKDLQAAKNAEVKLQESAEAELLEGKENGRAMHDLRENKTRQQVCQEMITTLEQKLAVANQEIADFDLANLAKPWEEAKSEFWHAIPGMMKTIAEMNGLTVKLFEKIGGTKPFSSDDVVLKTRALQPLHTVSKSLYAAWEMLQYLNSLSPDPISWPETGRPDELRGFGKKL